MRGNTCVPDSDGSRRTPYRDRASLQLPYVRQSSHSPADECLSLDTEQPPIYICGVYSSPLSLPSNSYSYVFFVIRALCVSTRKTTSVDEAPTANLACRAVNPLFPASFPCPVPYQLRSSARPCESWARLLRSRFIVCAAFACSDMSAGVNSSSAVVSFTSLARSVLGPVEIDRSFNSVLQNVSTNSFAVPIASPGSVSIDSFIRLICWDT